MADYHHLSKELQMQIEEDRRHHKCSPYACKDEDIVRRRMDHDRANLWRPAFVRDTEKILHNPYYNRYSDKTQVFSFYKNDDISRRALHVQLVSRVARNIGAALGLNTDLLEAISLGHDIGHTPFGHAGERFLNELYHAHTGRYFHHNVHSVRVLDRLVKRNVSLQVLDGVLSHNGEMELSEYRPADMADFAAFDARVEACYAVKEANNRQIPYTLEGCVMRISDIIAYLGKDRQDAERLGLLDGGNGFSNAAIGTSNAEIINNMIVNIIENSYGKPYLCMDEAYYDAFAKAKRENYTLIYGNEELEQRYRGVIRPMFDGIYAYLLKEAEALNAIAKQTGDDELLPYMKKQERVPLLFSHHAKYLQDQNRYADDFSLTEYLSGEVNDIVVDFIASMTDDYFMELHHYLYPDSELRIAYHGYFEE